MRLVAAKRRPTVEQMLEVLKQVREAVPDIMHNARAQTPYSARVFSDIVVFANEIVKGGSCTDSGNAPRTD
jgi:hypothetical protein